MEVKEKQTIFNEDKISDIIESDILIENINKMEVENEDKNNEAI